MCVCLFASVLYVVCLAVFCTFVACALLMLGVCVCLGGVVGCACCMLFD